MVDKRHEYLLRILRAALKLITKRWLQKTYEIERSDRSYSVNGANKSQDNHCLYENKMVG